MFNVWLWIGRVTVGAAKAEAMELFAFQIFIFRADNHKESSEKVVSGRLFKNTEFFFLIVSCPVSCNQADWWKPHQKRPPQFRVTVWQTYSTRWVSPIFTNLKLSACHWLPDGLLCCVTDIRKTPKPNLHSQRDEGGLKSGRRRCIL